jgi:phosphomevalonate kinase
MSFGFSIGDFIAVSQLAHRLYKDVFLVARGAPKELQILMGEIALLSQSINLLIDEIKNPDSILVRAGEGRVDMVNRIMMQANATLKDLEKFADKYDFSAKAGERAKVKRVWDKVRFARELSSLDELRKKVQDHNGKMILLLTSAGK